MKKLVNRIRLISVTRERWGAELRKSLSALTNHLLPLERLDIHYWFTGKLRPKLAPNETLVFRFEGKLLGEAAFLRWSEKDRDCMIYRPIQRYRDRIVASEFISVGHNPYSFIPAATIRAIRKAALTVDSGPYPKTGEKESIAKHRIGQGLVRESALERYEKRCCLCQMDEPALLIAGHIRGWAKGKKARSNPENVILMCAFHDSLFGRGFISLNPETFDLRISKKKLSVGTFRQVLRFTSTFRAPTSHPPARDFLAWHTTHVFQK